MNGDVQVSILHVQNNIPVLTVELGKDRCPSFHPEMLWRKEDTAMLEV